MPPCLTLSVIRYRSRVKWSNPGKGVAPSLTPLCSSYRKGRLLGHPQLRSPTLLYFYIHHHPHHVAPSAQISLTLSCHPSQLSIASGRFSGVHPVSAQSCSMLGRAGHPAFAHPSEGVHGSTSLMSSSLLLQLCPACLVHLTLIVFMMGGKWPYSCCFIGCCLQDFFNIACNILL